MTRRALTDTLGGVLGISKWGNWPYLAGSWSWDFVRARYGDPNDRPSRLKAYSAVRQWLALDHSVQPALRLELQKRLEFLGVNPLEESVFDEAEIARRQYAALLRYAQDPNGLAARLEKDRHAEVVAYAHDWKERVGLRVVNLATLGIYAHKDQNSDTLLARLDRERRAERGLRYLETVAGAPHEQELAWSVAEVKRALDQLAATGFQGRSAQVVERILRTTSDEETRALCRKALESLDAAGN